MEKFYKNKFFIILAICLCTALCGIVYYFSQNNDESEYVELDNISENIIELNKVEEIKKIKVHVSGEVINPGVIEIEEGTRIIDAINKSGGLTEEADISQVNLAYILEDAMKIYIPNVNETEEINLQIVSLENGSISNIDNSKIMVNINTASEEELQKLDGIGASIATKIVSYRKQNGKYSSIEELKNITGIGESKYERIKNYIYVK